MANIVRRIIDASKQWWWLQWGSNTEVKHTKLCPMATKHGRKNRWCKFRRIMTFMEVKGQQRSNIENNALRLPSLVIRTADASLGWQWPSWRSKVDRSNIIKNALWLPNMVRRITDSSLGGWWPSWRSKVNRSNIVNYALIMATKHGQRNHWCKFRMTMTFMVVKDQQRSNIVNYALIMASKHGQKNHWFKFRRMIPFMEIKGQQRSNIVNYALWLSYFVWRTADASLGWQWPSWTSKVNRVQT